MVIGNLTLSRSEDEGMATRPDWGAPDGQPSTVPGVSVQDAVVVASPMVPAAPGWMNPIMPEGFVSPTQIAASPNALSGNALGELFR